MKTQPGNGYKAFCLALPAALLSAAVWVPVVIECNAHLTTGQGVGVLVAGLAGTFAVVYALSWLGFRGRTAGFSVLWVLALGAANGLAVAAIAGVAAALGVWGPVVVWWATAGAAGAGMVLGGLWVAAANRLGDSNLLAFMLCRRLAIAGFPTGFLLGGVAGLLILGPSMVERGAAESKLTVKGPGIAAGGIAAIAFPAIAGGLSLGFVGGYLGLTAGILRDLLVAGRPRTDSGSPYAPAHVLMTLAEKVVYLLNRKT